jgi:Tfp pilus assembly protein PilV
MRSKAPLALMEQLVMVMVFALAATLCVQVFVLSGQASRRSEARDRAVLVAQNAAELLKSGGGDTADHLAAAAGPLGGSVSQGVLQVDYSADWEPIARAGVYRLTAQSEPSDVAGLAAAEVSVAQGEDVLVRLQVAWQTEVGGDG